VIELLPTEFNLAGVYMPPLLVAAGLGLLLAVITAKLMNRYKLTDWFSNPSLVFVAMVFNYAMLCETVMAAL
jgi:hypothetical protein